MSTPRAHSIPSSAQAFDLDAPLLSCTSDGLHQPTGRSRSVMDVYQHAAQSPRDHSSRKRPHPDSPSGVIGPSDWSQALRFPTSIHILRETDSDGLSSLTALQGTPSTPGLQFSHIQGRYVPSAPATPRAPSVTPSPAKRPKMAISDISHPSNTDVRTSTTNATGSTSSVTVSRPVYEANTGTTQQVGSTRKQKEKESIVPRQRSPASVDTASLLSPPTTVVKTSPHLPSQDGDKSLLQPLTQPPSVPTTGRSLSTETDGAPPGPRHPLLGRPPNVSSQPAPQPRSHPGQFPEQQQQTNSVPSQALHFPKISFAQWAATVTIHSQSGSPLPLGSMGLGHPSSSVRAQSSFPVLDPVASVQSATTPVAPTPLTLPSPTYANEKLAFLARFEILFDALRYTEIIEGSLREVLQTSNTLNVALQQQQTHLDQLITLAVQRQLMPMNDQIQTLRLRIEELKHALQLTKAPMGECPPSHVSGQSPSASTSKPKDKAKAKANNVCPSTADPVPILTTASLSAVALVPRMSVAPTVEHAQGAIGSPEQARHAVSPVHPAPSPALTQRDLQGERRGAGRGTKPLEGCRHSRRQRKNARVEGGAAT